jgi:CBS domain-containing protein
MPPTAALNSFISSPVPPSGLDQTGRPGMYKFGAGGVGTPSKPTARRSTMPTAREIMTPGAEWVTSDVLVSEAARKMSKDDFGALPVCDGDGRLQGVVTDRDLVVKVIAAGRDPQSTRVGEITDRPEVVTIGADDSAEEAIRTMKDHGVRRLPVVDGKQLVGMVSQADIARVMPDAKVGDLVGAISETAPNN